MKTPIQTIVSSSRFINDKTIIVEIDIYKTIYVARLVDISFIPTILHTVRFTKCSNHTLSYITHFMLAYVETSRRIKAYIASKRSTSIVNNNNYNIY